MHADARTSHAAWARLLAALVVAVALAGCSDKGEGPPELAPDAAATLALPVWAMGEYWSYTTTDPEGQTSTMTIVVTADEGASYTVDTTEATTAYYHAGDDISYLGDVRKSDLAGSQGNDRVRYFDFPLEAGTTWSTPWDGQTVQAEVVSVGAGQAEIRATAGGTPFADYTFGTGFLEEIIFYDENASASYTMDLDNHGLDFAGTVYRYALGDPLTFSAADASMVMETLTLAPDINELGIEARGVCNGAAAGVLGGVLTQRDAGEPHVPQLLVATEEPAFAFRLDCTQAQEGADEAVIPVVEGADYHLELGAAAQGGTVEFTVEPRTRSVIQVG